MATQVLGRPVRNAVSSGRRKSTKRMRNIRSMCRDIEPWDVNEVQIPGKKNEPQQSLLDTLGYPLVFIAIPQEDRFYHKKYPYSWSKHKHNYESKTDIESHEPTDLEHTVLS